MVDVALLELPDVRSWPAEIPPAEVERALPVLERGGLIVLPRLAFHLQREEGRALASGAAARGSKHVLYEPDTGRVRRAAASGPDLEALRSMMARYADGAATLLGRLLPRYAGALRPGRVSFRSEGVAGRPVSSFRRDDTRLHVDAYPSNPVGGARLLRVFSNVDPAGRPRVWSLGPPFEEIARRYGPGLRPPFLAADGILTALGILKRRRRPYDHLMVQIHDALKRDAAFQAGAARREVRFPAGSTWVVFSDQVCHAVLAGQFALEQTFYCPVEAMAEPERSPLRVLEAVRGTRLA